MPHEKWSRELQQTCKKLKCDHINNFYSYILPIRQPKWGQRQFICCNEVSLNQHSMGMFHNKSCKMDFMQLYKRVTMRNMMPKYHCIIRQIAISGGLIAKKIHLAMW